MTAPLVHLNGHPGVGKLTIARALQDRLPGARLLDNHSLLDPALALFDRGTPEVDQLRFALRALVFDAAQAVADDVPIILTDALDDSDLAAEIFAPVRALAAATGRPLRRFILEVSEAENLRRLEAADRIGRFKLRDPAILLDGRKHLRILGWDDPGVNVVDVSDKGAEAAAAVILRLLEGPP